MENTKTTDLKSFNYLENGEVMFSMFDTLKTVKKITPGIYDVSYIDHPEYRVTLKHILNKESIKIYNFAEKNKIDDIIQAFVSTKVIEKLKKLEFLHKIGILLYGKEGTGKTTIVNYYSNKLILENSAIVLRIKYSGYRLSEIIDFINNVRNIQDNLIIVIFDEFDEFVKEGNEGLLKTFLDGSSSTNNTIFLAMTNYIEKIPDSLKNRPSRFKYKIEIEGIQSNIEIKSIIMNMIGDIIDEENINKYSIELQGQTLDHIKQFCLDKIMEITTYNSSRSKIGFK